MNKKLEVVLDFCGVVNIRRAPYKDKQITGDTHPELWTTLKNYQDAGYSVTIATARHSLPQVELWLKFEARKAGRESLVQNLKFERKPLAYISIDDRATQFTGTFPSVQFIENFRPWEVPHPSEAEISENETLPSQSHLTIEETIESLEGSQT